VVETRSTTMVRALRDVSDEILWYAQRGHWRFAYRDPYDGARRFLNCLPDRFEIAGIPLPSPDVVRRPTEEARRLCARLKDEFMATLREARPEALETAPVVSEVANRYFDLYDGQTPGYRASLRAIFSEFADAASDKPVDELDDVDLKNFERGLAARGLSNASIRSYLAQVGMLLNFALKKGWLRSDPRATYRKPKEELRDPNPFTDAELEAFFGFTRAPSRFRPDGYAAAEWTGVGLLTLGLRPVELMGARWENVDFDERFLFVAESHGNKLRQARQWQPIPLAAWPRFLERRRDSGPIWTAHGGGEITKCSLARSRNTLRRAVPNFTWKRFRKTFATILHDAGNETIIVSRLLRHSAGGKNVSVAQRHYVGRSGALLRTAVDEAFARYAGLIGGAAAGVEAELRLA
jgi:integrase